MDGRTEGRTSRNSPLCSTGHRPLGAAAQKVCKILVFPLSNSMTPDQRTDGPMDGRTKHLIELRVRNWKRPRRHMRTRADLSINQSIRQYLNAQILTLPTPYIFILYSHKNRNRFLVLNRTLRFRPMGRENRCQGKPRRKSVDQ